MSFCYINRDFVPVNQAFVPIQDLGFLRGYAVFDFFRTYHRKPLFLEAHLDRFFSSAKMMGLSHDYTKEKLKDVVFELIDRTTFEEEVGVKMILTGGVSVDGMTPGQPILYMMPSPILLPTPQAYTAGLGLLTLDYEREYPLVKSTNYMAAVKARSLCDQQGAFDVLYHHDGYVSEASRSNFYIVKSGRLVTPNQGVLFGITRSKITKIAEEKGILEERPIRLDEVFESDECMISSSTKRIIPVTSVDQTTIGSGKMGPVCRDLLADFMALEKKSV